MNLIIPKDYNPVLDLRDTEIAIKLVKDFFEDELSSSDFFRIHRNYLVNMKKIKSFDRSKSEFSLTSA